MTASSASIRYGVTESLSNSRIRNLENLRFAPKKKHYKPEQSNTVLKICQELADCAMRISTQKPIIRTIKSYIPEYKMKNPMHPGEFIFLAYMEPLELQAIDLADRLGISQSTLSRILNKKMDISYEMAVRLSTVLGRSPESWVNLQSAYSLDKAKSKLDTSQLKPLIYA